MQIGKHNRYTSYSKIEYEVVIVDGQGKLRDRQKRQAECRTEVLRKEVDLNLVMIPGGSFQMGSPEGEGYYAERPQHPVTVESFWMGRYPVTQAQWKTVAGFPKVKRDLSPAPSTFKSDNRPVECVDWYEAEEFCQRLSEKIGREYRLPSEAEWEYACRAGTTTPFHFGSTLTTDLANYKEHYQGTTEVGKFSFPNGFGLSDMHGNVWEWCLDHMHESYQDAPTDASAWVTGGDKSLRLLRGGSWAVNLFNCRSATRNRYCPDDGNLLIGFRVVSGSARTMVSSVTKNGCRATPRDGQ